MAASINEVILTSFVADPEGLRDLDSIVRQRCQDMTPPYAISYKVTRRDSLRYDTEDIETLLKERNGEETHIESVEIQAEVEQNGLKFFVSFGRNVTISGESEDRANLVLLASDVRALIRDHMKSRGSGNWRVRVMIAALAAFFIGLFGFAQFTSVYSSNNSEKYNAQYQRFAMTADAQMRRENTNIQSLITKYRQSPPNGTVDAIKFLTQVQILQLGILDDQNTQNISAPIGNSNDPWWVASAFLPIVIGIVLAGLAFGIGYLVYPRAEAVFLIGEEIRRQVRLAKIRDRLIWSIGATFILGIASGIVATAIL
jgi:hypothetical protein